MPKYLGDRTLSIPCEACGHQTDVTLSELGKSPTVACVKCGISATIPIEKLGSAMRAIDAKLDDLQTELNKTFDIKIA